MSSYTIEFDSISSKGAGALKTDSRFHFIIITVCCLLVSMLIDGCGPENPEGRAGNIFEKSGIKGRFVVHLNCGDGSLTARLKLNDRYWVHGLIPVGRMTTNHLPYTDHRLNLPVAENLSDVSIGRKLRMDSKIE
jgi:hypothetical protein